MRPLGYSLDQMKAVMDDLEVLAGHADDARAAARARLAELRRDASERRTTLERQLGMADEFLSLLDDQVADPGPGGPDA